MYLSRNGVITGFFFGGGGAAAGDQQAIVISLTALDHMQLDQGQTGAAGAEAVQLARDSGERVRLIRAAGRLHRQREMERQVVEKLGQPGGGSGRSARTHS